MSGRTMSSGFRVRILCEDRLSERFLRKLCKARHIKVLDVQVAPAGKGAGSAWVIEKYAEMVRKRRSKNFQQNLGLLVHVDGDDVGVDARKRQLEKGLISQAIEPRGSDEPVAVLVPTWCVETWLLHLAGIAQPPETAQLKRDPKWHGETERLKTLALDKAAVGWSSFEPAPPSLRDGRVEASRVGI